MTKDDKAGKLSDPRILAANTLYQKYQDVTNRQDLFNDPMEGSLFDSLQLAAWAMDKVGSTVDKIVTENGDENYIKKFWEKKPIISGPIVSEKIRKWD